MKLQYKKVEDNINKKLISIRNEQSSYFPTQIQQVKDMLQLVNGTYKRTTIYDIEHRTHSGIINNLEFNHCTFEDVFLMCLFSGIIITNDTKTIQEFREEILGVDIEKYIKER